MSVSDVVVIGGGIGGAALSFGLASGGLGVGAFAGPETIPQELLDPGLPDRIRQA